eukprot:scaffold37471_cov61-Attheya_sp.AAC.1
MCILVPVAPGISDDFPVNGHCCLLKCLGKLMADRGSYVKNVEKVIKLFSCTYVESQQLAVDTYPVLGEFVVS